LSYCLLDDGLTTEEEDEEEVIVPGPDGRLISSDERMQHVRQAQAEAGGRITPEGMYCNRSQHEQ